PIGRGMAAPDGLALVVGGGWSNAIGRWGSRTSAQVDLIAGAVGNAGRARPAFRGRIEASGGWWSLEGDAARVQDGSAIGGALLARGRLGPSTGLHLSAHAEERDGIDPAMARALVDAPLEPAGGFLVSDGWTGGASLGLPLGSRITLMGEADGDASTREIVDARGSLELHDPCGCVVLRATVAHRIGREGVDAWLSVDLPR
ncbi:MAG: hypothetical protein ACRENE_34425, partial [Polyangiaceae bacterium]